MRAKYSANDIREYVERELDRTIRANHPDFEVVAGNRWMDTSKRRKRSDLLWTIEGGGDRWVGDYIIEARVKEGELLIWYGYSTAGAFSTHHLMRQAVHLDLAELDFAQEQYRTEAYSLGAVLELMLRSRDVNEVSRFPMNRYMLT
jgi:hypothetical protein